jgi:hypothetical protein
MCGDSGESFPGDASQRSGAGYQRRAASANSGARQLLPGMALV